MNAPIEPYLKILHKEIRNIANAVSDDSCAASLDLCQKILGSLLGEQGLAEGLQNNFLRGMAMLLDETCAALADVQGGPLISAQLVQHIRTRPDYARAERALQECVRTLLTKKYSTALTVVTRINDLLARLHEDLYASVLRLDLPPETADQGPTGNNSMEREKLEVYLRRKFAEPTDCRIRHLAEVYGGGSKRTIIATLTGALHLPEKIVFRVDKSGYGSVVGSTVLDEYFIIEKMFAAGVPVPKPHLLEASSDVLGAPFMVLDFIDGHTIGDWIYVTRPSRSFATQLAQALARIHSVAVDGDVAARLSSGGDLVEQMRTSVLDFEKAWRLTGEPNIALEQAYHWLKENVAYCQGRTAIIHGDAGCNNILARNGYLMAILDWETATIGNPAQDLAYVRPAVTQMMEWQEFLSIYEAAGGVLPSQDELDFYEIWRCVFAMHWSLVARSYVNAEVSDGLIHAYGAQRIYQHIARDLYVALENILYQ
ncbi:MAG: phosphotransferase family protein [Porticoccaceae bacterium]